MKVIKCRKCNALKRISALKTESEYPNGILCYDCWNPPKKIHSHKSSTSSGSFSKSQSSHKNNNSSHRTMENDSMFKYEVGDSVFINTDRFGVLLCQIIDQDAWGDQLFCSIDVKGKVLEYIEEDEMFDSALEAGTSNRTLKV